MKNFIRHGKQAYGTTPNGSGMAPLTESQSHKAFVSDVGDSRQSGVAATTAPIAIGPDYTASSSNTHAEEPKSKTYDHAVKQIVASENEQRAHMPTYPGLERYNLLQKMGDGAFSIVYRAVDVHTQEQVAVKVIRKQDLNPTQVCLFVC